jgi:hypothetical protein
MMIDVTDHGCVYNPRTQEPDAVGEQEDAPFGVRLLQVQGHYIIGGLDSKAADGSGNDPNRLDSYFLIDTQTNKRSNFPT